MLRIENLSVAVKGKQILKDINLHIAPGEVHVCSVLMALASLPCWAQLWASTVMKF